MTIEDFVFFSHKQLSLIENFQGEVVYSSAKTFEKGKYYYLGLNPGGEGKISIKEHLDSFSTKSDNDYFDAIWNTKKKTYHKGESPLQLRTKYLFNELLNYNLRDVFSTNLIFETTNNADNLNYGLAGICWPVHLLALSVVQPQIIITCGNDSGKSAFSFIADLYAHNKKIESHSLETKLFNIKTIDITIQNRLTLLIGLPHLSRFEIRENKVFNQKFLNIISNYKFKYF